MAAGLAWIGAFAAPASPAPSAPARTTTVFCSLSGYDIAHRFVWTGPSPGSWFDPANWNDGQGPHRVPGNAPGTPGSNDPTPALNQANSDYVCIGHHARVEIPPGKHVGVSVLDVGQQAALRVSHGSMLYVNARLAGRASHVRDGSRLTFGASTLGGKGTLIVSGQLHMTALGHFVSTQVTRWCDDYTTCTYAAGEDGGRTVISAQGEMDVDGLEGGGVGIAGRRTIDNLGSIRLTHHGFLAPDDGTVIDNEAGAVIRIANNRGIFEGFVIPGEPLPVLRNAGLIAKTAGSGSALIGARYESDQGRIDVRTGSLSLAGGGSIPKAFVAPGASYGNTACTRSGCTATQTSGAHPRAAQVRLPLSSQPSPVSIVFKRPGTGSNGFGGPVAIGVPAATSTRAHPTRLALRYDDSVVPDQPGPIRVYRLGKGTVRILVGPCTSSGDVPSGRSACVVRARCLSGTGADSGQKCGGVDVVVNTYRTFSRWIAT